MPSSRIARLYSVDPIATSVLVAPSDDTNMRAVRNADQIPPLGQGIQGWYVLKFAHPQGGTRH